MSRFVSFAQNNEDVMLWRALGDVAHGTYIDVGAHDPVVDSVTKAFYDRGWRGINIEPVTYWHDKIVADRPEDVNLNVAVSSSPGEVVLHEVEGTGLSTMDANIAGRHAAAGWPVRVVKVQARTLDSIVEEFHPDAVQFLKIDVEGWETEVIRSLDLSKTRPWIVLIEATSPLTTDQTFTDWESLLLDRGYLHVYSDGLNRFYVAVEKESLRERFAVPPNYFDHFVRQREVWLEQHAKRLEGEADVASKRIVDLERDLGDANVRTEAMRSELAAVQQRQESDTLRMANKRADIEQLQDQTEDSALRLVQAASRVEALHGQLSAAQERHIADSQRFAAKDEALESLRQQLADATRRHSQLGSHTERLRAELAAAHQRHIDDARAVAAAEITLEQMRQSADDAMRRAGCAESKGERFYRRIIALRLNSGRLRGQSKEHAAQLARCVADLTDVRRELESQTRRQATTQRYIGGLEDKIDELTLAMRPIQAERDRLGQACRRLEEHYAIVTGSRSWRITRPLREAGILLRRMLGRKLPDAP